jgi:hypothetical protein
MSPRTSRDGLRAGDRIRLLRVGDWQPALEAEALATLEAAVGQVHPIDHIDEYQQVWLAFEVAAGHWHTFKIYTDDYEKAN